MNKENQNEKFIREQVQKLLLEFDLGGGWVSDQYGAGPRLDVWNTLFTPFIDVFKVAMVAAKDVTSAAIDIADYAITFDLEKQKNIKERFRQRREKYKGKMKEAMKSTDAAFNGPDAKLFTLMAAPGMVLGKAAAGLTWDAAEPVRDKVDEFFGGTLGIGDTAIAATTAADKSPGLMADLKRAFFGEGLDEVDQLELILIEQEKSKDADPPSDEELRNLADEYIKKSGFQDEIDAFWNDLIEDKQKEIDEILKTQRDKIVGLTELAQAETMDDAKTAAQKLAEMDVDFSKPLTQIEAALKEEAEKMQAGGDEVDKVIEQLRKSPQAKGIAKDAPVEEFFPIIETGLLANTFGAVVEEAKNASAGDLLGFVAEMSPDDLGKLSKMSPRGKEYADMIFKFRDDLLSI